MADQEREALHALNRGDIAGLEALVHIHQLQALRVAYGITGDLATAEDVVADAFITVYDRIGQYDEQRPFAPWFYRIVVNGALRALRDRSRIHTSTIDSGAWLLNQTGHSPGPEMEAEQRELRAQVLAQIYMLPPDQRAAVVLRYYLDMSEAAIAETLDCPLGTVKWRLHTAKQKLRQALAPEGEETWKSHEG